MMTSTFLVPAASALLGALMYRHHRQVFAWTRRMRRKDETNTEYDKPSAWLADLYAAQCGLAQKPCAAEDFKDIATIGNMLAGIADHTEGVRFELTRVVESVRGYVATALPAQGPAARVGLPEHRTRLEQAMRQEAARDELAHAILAAEQRIKDLRHS
ncbi:hypothetical protein [Streptomyces prunicolor]|jgi:hypothetical protein|uniref:hypothetical protein n=1 Tax=Streptomyces prunicolor TaxID=67348 RepID=UPI0003803D3E|nr:hypothetical protein [Streptomyces prunicolor]